MRCSAAECPADRGSGAIRKAISGRDSGRRSDLRSGRGRESDRFGIGNGDRNRFSGGRQAAPVTARTPMGTETRIDDLINRWEEMRERGTPLTIEELCAHCPELVAEVRHRIRALRAVDSALDIEVHGPATDTRGPSSRGRRDRSRAARGRAGHGGLSAPAPSRPWRAGGRLHGPPGGAGPHGGPEADPARPAPRRGAAAVPPRGRASPPGCSTPASCRSTAWGRTTTGRSTPCPSSRARPSRRRSSGSTGTNRSAAIPAGGA